MTEFIRREMRQNLRNGFSILLPTADMVRLFVDNTKLSHTVAVTQYHHSLRLIINLLAQPNEGASIVNDTTKREVSPESM